MMNKNQFSQANLAHLAGKVGSQNQIDSEQQACSDKQPKPRGGESGSQNVAVMLGGRHIQGPWSGIENCVWVAVTEQQGEESCGDERSDTGKGRQSGARN